MGSKTQVLGNAAVPLNEYATIYILLALSRVILLWDIDRAALMEIHRQGKENERGVYEILETKNVKQEDLTKLISGSDLPDGANKYLAMPRVVRSLSPEYSR